ncbi:hypothetical protein [Paracoccus sp. (in: a-proteobacteria)]|uniref:hypothetical protein n=1 Tax=Paracoccus sp. TaxID=267 RepID=UPI0028B02606|nr:hypothetical protein [Paracoccus sp. (in: a-proteobacteria)]
MTANPLIVISCSFLIVAGVSVLPLFISWAIKRREKEEFDPDYDRIVNALIRGGMIEIEDKFTVKAGDLRIWVENYPYSYGHPYGCGVSADLKLSNQTKKALRDHVARLSVLKVLERVRRA